MLNVVATDGLDKEAVELLQKDSQVALSVHKGVEKKDLLGALKDADVVVIRSATKIDASIIKELPKLKAVIRAGVGIDNVDLKAASSSGLWVWNAPNGNYQSTAEMAIAHLFALARKIPFCTESAKQGLWVKKEMGTGGRQLSGMKLGILGAGNIGSKVAKMAHGIGMSVSISDPYYKPKSGDPYSVVGFDELLSQSDAISIHVPFMETTKHIFDYAAFKKMKKSSFIINVARGGIINDADLLRALEEGLIAGAGLDVFEEEPTPADHPVYKKLLKLSNVVSTPHVGASTQEAQKLVGLETAEKILSLSQFLQGKLQAKELSKALNDAGANARLKLN